MVDENYVRESIVSPGSKIVAGYKPIMPTFQGLISDDQLNALVAYVKSISQQQKPGQPAGSDVAAGTQTKSQQVH
jgi:cytochrome c oxidase subunit 2